MTVPHSQGGLINFVFIAPENDFRKLRSTYPRTLNSLQVKLPLPSELFSASRRFPTHPTLQNLRMIL